MRMGNVHDEVTQFEIAEIRAVLSKEKLDSKSRYRDLIATRRSLSFLDPDACKLLNVCSRKPQVSLILRCCGVFSQFAGTGLTGYYLR